MRYSIFIIELGIISVLYVSIIDSGTKNTFKSVYICLSLNHNNSYLQEWSRGSQCPVVKSGLKKTDD